jgi:heme a synthase
MLGSRAATTLHRAHRRRAVSPAAFRRFAFVALGSLFVVVVTGAVVRLTASGLGCENWPRCGETPFPEKEFHALIEFGNRVVALFAMGCTTLAALAARRVRGLPRWVVRTSAVVAAAIVAQVPLGGITVILELHPLAVMSHFLLALVAVALAVVVALGADRFARDRPPAPFSPWVGRLALALVPLALVLVVSGAFVTAAGPHSGGADIERLGNLLDAVYVHVRVTAVFGIGLLVLVALVFRARGRAGLERAIAGGVLVLVVVQMLVGEVQWRNQLPWWLVLIHVALATAVWAGVVALATLLCSASATDPAHPMRHTRVSES